MEETALLPNARLWRETGYDPSLIPAMPKNRNERLEAHNIYTVPNAWAAINDEPGDPNKYLEQQGAAPSH